MEKVERYSRQKIQALIRKNKIKGVKVRENTWLYGGYIYFDVEQNTLERMVGTVAKVADALIEASIPFVICISGRVPSIRINAKVSELYTEKNLTGEEITGYYQDALDKIRETAENVRRIRDEEREKKEAEEERKRDVIRQLNPNMSGMSAQYEHGSGSIGVLVFDVITPKGKQTGRMSINPNHRAFGEDKKLHVEFYWFEDRRDKFDLRRSYDDYDTLLDAMVDFGSMFVD